jgi:post-segregation antitoxin (ccd killing protein)
LTAIPVSARRRVIKDSDEDSDCGNDNDDDNDADDDDNDNDDDDDDDGDDDVKDNAADEAAEMLSTNIFEGVTAISGFFGNRGGGAERLCNEPSLSSLVRRLRDAPTTIAPAATAAAAAAAKRKKKKRWLSTAAAAMEMTQRSFERVGSWLSTASSNGFQKQFFH